MTDDVTFYREADADADALANQTIAVIGYGNLGKSMALNLRDSGLDVIVGNINDGYRMTAGADGFEVSGIAGAVARGDVVYVLIPDEVMSECYVTAIEPALSPGKALCFASGYALAYDLVKPSGDVDVLMIAPRMLGEEVRRTYLEGTGFLSYVSVEHDATGSAWQRLLALAHAAGSLRRGAMCLTAESEALIDLFIEQSVGPYLGALIQTAFQVGTEAGLPPEALVLEMYMSGEMSRTFQTMADVGYFKSASWHGAVAQYGGFVRLADVELEPVQRMFRRALEDIRTGEFARKFQQEQEGGYQTVNAINELTSGNNPISDAEERVRAALSDNGRR